MLRAKAKGRGNDETAWQIASTCCSSSGDSSLSPAVSSVRASSRDIPPNGITRASVSTEQSRVVRMTVQFWYRYRIGLA
jgi:hypothetical protein